ncbi:MAG: helix-turn-helix domain-containing protein [Acetivibrio sp.]
MLYVVVADEDTKNAQSIKRVIEKGTKGMKVVTCLGESREVIEKIKNLMPALAILGVSLNGLNGLEIARYLGTIKASTKIILISSYNHFEFAREAIHLNVQDYLLKPLIESQLIDSVTEAVEKYKREATAKEEMENQKKQMEESRRHTEYSLIYSALFNGEASEEIKNYKKMFLLGEMGYIINIEIDSFDSDSLINLKKDDVQINKYLRRIVSEHNNCVIGPRMLNRILVWVDSSEKGRKVPTSSMADIKLAAHIIVALKDRFLINVSIGIGGEKSIFNLHASYEEAVRCLRYKGVHNVVRIHDVEQKEISPTEYNELENLLLKSIKFGKAEIVNLFVELLDKIRGLEENVYRNKIYEVLVLAAHESRLAGQNSLDYIDFKQYFENKWDLPIEQVERWAYQRFEYLINSVQSSRLEIRSDGVNSAIHYMEEHYMEEITLEEISRYVGISPQHFSKIFKEETGINYIEWLTDLRLDIAKRLLAEGGKTVKEVCYVVGYNDPNYFSRIFKKAVGISPTEFARGITPNDYLKNTDSHQQ